MMNNIAFLILGLIIILLVYPKKYKNEFFQKYETLIFRIAIVTASMLMLADLYLMKP